MPANLLDPPACLPAWHSVLLCLFVLGSHATVCRCFSSLEQPTHRPPPAPARHWPGLHADGYKIMRVLGVKMTKLTNSRGFIVEMSSAAIVIIGSRYGLPLSTTHTLVGALRWRCVALLPCPPARLPCRPYCAATGPPACPPSSPAAPPTLRCLPSPRCRLRHRRGPAGGPRRHEPHPAGPLLRGLGGHPGGRRPHRRSLHRTGHLRPQPLHGQPALRHRQLPHRHRLQHRPGGCLAWPGLPTRACAAWLCGCVPGCRVRLPGCVCRCSPPLKTPHAGI
jgi:hypothetical protein